MIGFGTLFCIFGACLIIEGITNRHGHRPNVVINAHIYKNMTKKELANMGNYLILIGSSIVISSLLCFLFEEENILPIIVMIILIIISIIVYNKVKNNRR